MTKTKLTRYWHGGASGLHVGDRLVPPSQRNAPTAADLVGAYEYPSDRGRVYITTDKRYARACAATYINSAGRPGGCLYNVKPAGELEPDADMLDGVGFACRAARVVAVVEQGVRMSEYEIRRAFGPHYTWSDDSPIYTSDGWALPSPDHLRHGITAEHLRALGQWPAVDEIQRCTGTSAQPAPPDRDPN